MYLRKIRIRNVRSIKALDWTFPRGEKAGWHVVIGDNGSGKTTLLRSIALALVGPSEALALRQDWGDWLRIGEEQGKIRLDLTYNRAKDKVAGSGTLIRKSLIAAQVNFVRDDSAVKIVAGKVGTPTRYLWSGKSGWFSASYGPFRRFTGGDKEYERIFYSSPKLAAHLSCFGENIALTESMRWLQDLQFKRLENAPEGKLLASVTRFVNQNGFLPHKTTLTDISSTGVHFVDGNGFQVKVENLSDGYRSVLSMAFELIRQLARSYGPGSIFNHDSTKIIRSGVVLIDEADAHLHPTWQKQIGIWLRRHFPNLQFIVTTHSPLICQAADVGTVWRLPSPGTDETGGLVTGPELDRLLFGNVLEAYSTEMFGMGITRSDASKQRLERLAYLNQKELQQGLSGNELREQAELRVESPTSAHVLTRDLG